jgi:GTP cyclohydrolase III
MKSTTQNQEVNEMKNQTPRYIQARNIKPFTHSVVSDITGEATVVTDTSWAEARIMKMVGTIDKISDIEIGQVNFFGGGGIELELDAYLPVVDSSEEAIAEAREEELAEVAQAGQRFAQAFRNDFRNLNH